ncbi:hypothetical protein IKB17_03370 [bacterium]|nr:hypothetical protein [bacterium]
MNKKQQIEKQIKHIELQLAKLGQQASKTEICEDLTNSLILKKAILKQDLKDLKKNPIIERVKKILPKKEKLICDYF